jgi:two-component sensor histidine kinase
MSAVVRGRRILLVAGDVSAAREWRAALQRAGAVVVGPLSTPQSAAERVQRQPVDAAVLAFGSPSGDMRELATTLMAQRIPALFASSEPTLGAGCALTAPVLFGPITPERLVAAVAGLLGDRSDAVADAVVEQRHVATPATDDQALAARIRQQEILAELGVAALRGPPLAELLNDTVRLAAQGLDAELCKVLEYQPARDQLLLRAGVGWHPNLIGRATVGADMASPSGYALHTGKPVISNHLPSEERFRTPALLAEHGVQRAINVILQGDGSPFGVLEVDSRSQGEFSEHDIAFLQGAANIVGMAIERQRYERRLKEALEYQRALVKEINHRVKNSLQLVASMLNLQAGADPAVTQQLQEASARVVAIARAHDRLYRSPQIDRIELTQYLDTVCADLAEVVPHCTISFASREQLWIGTDRAVRVALLVTELITNAAKHAYPEGQPGKLWVTMQRQDEARESISIRDGGVGLPHGFDAARSDGLGMRLAATLAEQSEARIEAHRLEAGSEFVVTLQLSEDDQLHRDGGGSG